MATLRAFHTLTALVVLLLTTGAAPPLHAPGPEPPSYAPTLDRASGRPGESVKVTFPQGMSIGSCLAGFVFPYQPCDRALTVLVPVPMTAPTTLKLVWEVTAEYRGKGSIEFQVLEPAFTVTANREEGSPDDRVIVTFKGPLITSCQVTLGDAVSQCKEFKDSWRAEIVVPAAGRVLVWRLSLSE